MFRAKILWLANGPTLKLEGKLAADWAEQARRHGNSHLQLPLQVDACPDQHQKGDG